MVIIMVMFKTSVADAKAKLSEYLDRVERGERVVICRHNKPVAELRGIDVSRSDPRPLGPLPGRPAFDVPASFFEPLPDDELELWEAGLAFAAAPGRHSAPRVAESKHASGKTPQRKSTRRRS